MFNWFSRQVETSAKSPESKPVEEKTPSDSSQTQKQIPEQTSQSSQEDYLTWAKLAYKNIQQRKGESQSEKTPETLETEADLQQEKTKKTENSKTPKTPASEVFEEFVPIKVTTTIETPKPSAQEVGEEPASIEEKTTPVWMHKSDRLEILKETAIETEKGEESGLAFDEEFVWSVKVLAAQGRAPKDISAEEISWLKRLRQGLGKTRRGLVNKLKAVVGQGPLNQDAVTEIEALLLQADVGLEATDHIITSLQSRLREETLPPEQAIAYLKEILRDILDAPLKQIKNPGFAPQKDTLNIWLMTGVNGAGKTTTIGKLAHLSKQSGYSCIIAAADTFRAAAVEQVKVWGHRSNTLVIANPGKNTDPAAVVFDSIAAAQSRKTELLLVDTAGRLQNKKNLMEELSKIRRIIDKKAPNAQVEALLVLDATLGQNGLRQAEVFSQSANLTGVVLTKLDGTAKGGVALAVSQKLNLPIRFISAGEEIEDLRPFSSYEFVEALLNA
ncbi:signal recognition particle-docking protein FtsY [cyanobacterium endosymbiont of Epithemia clementina EcSB]|uniref:signal recognition particle-docking protein FtsY n=1 Tax=cyanobacterium endosymbiont of Epithemia clementina EcSB TaxID=3034674 RepID=UPI0024807599|nr:signal recognition particle-docking protein FtsY [cyanobacterium endosymbiont of Epithemia clementina EcSB]WGT67792.1 signal recognition particle-docking protein FtsY [cyanobacterium endosymbiont of Epithemia clementina EcSB]